MTQKELDAYKGLRDLLFNETKVDKLTERELNMYTKKLNELSKKYIKFMKNGHKSTFEMNKSLRLKLEMPPHMRW